MPREIMLAFVQIVTAISLALLISELIYVLVNVIFKKHRERITFLRSFKKGQCAVVYLTAIPLYWVGHIYAGDGLLNGFFMAIHRIINLVMLRYETASISALMDVNLGYRITVYFCFVMVGMNAILFTLSLTAQYIWSASHALGALLTKRNRLYIFGNSPENVDIYRSDKKRAGMIIDRLSDEEQTELYMEKVAFVNSTSLVGRAVSLLGLATKLNREYVFVINTGSDERNIDISNAIVNRLRTADAKVREKLFLKLKVYVFGDPRYQTIYEDIISSGYGCIHYVNKYQRVAMDFIDRYPLARFMDERQIDYSSSLVRDGVDVNLVFIGFGRTNQQIFLTSVANNQFITAGDDAPVLKPVKYFIFDKDYAENNKNLNHNYYRLKHEIGRMNEADYLPLPSLPAEEKYFHLDINNARFYEDIREICMRSSLDANYIVIAFGNDLENLDMAQKLVEKRKEWGIDNLTIFAKTRAWRKEQTLIEEDGCYLIGNERDCVYNIDKIVGDEIYKMAMLRNEVYDLEYEITQNPDVAENDSLIRSIGSAATSNWFKSKSQMERDSSLYCCLSLRSKLNMMGLDYRPASAEGVGLSYDEYMSIYAVGDMPNRGKYSVKAKGKDILHYGIDFADSRRKNMAIHEHQRWNSFMISRGMVPATKEQIAKEQIRDKDGNLKFSNGKNYSVRRHGNLTTFDGLVDFRRIVAAREGKSEELYDVIKYDYQILDDAHWLLSSCGYKIVRM